MEFAVSGRLSRAKVVHTVALLANTALRRRSRFLRILSGKSNISPVPLSVCMPPSAMQICCVCMLPPQQTSSSLQPTRISVKPKGLLRRSSSSRPSKLLVTFEIGDNVVWMAQPMLIPCLLTLETNRSSSISLLSIPKHLR